jgi:hypothetical protein
MMIQGILGSNAYAGENCAIRCGNDVWTLLWCARVSIAVSTIINVVIIHVASITSLLLMHLTHTSWKEFMWVSTDSQDNHICVSFSSYATTNGVLPNETIMLSSQTRYFYFTTWCKACTDYDMLIWHKHSTYVFFLNWSYKTPMTHRYTHQNIASNTDAAQQPCGYYAA